MRGKRVYFDAMVFIYLVEGFESLEKPLREIRDSLLHAEAAVTTSELALCETLVIPFRRGETALVASYRQFIEDSGAFEVRQATRETWVRASLLRARMGLKTPDALHVATAIEAGCEIFVTNDKTLRTPTGMRIERIF